MQEAISTSLLDLYSVQPWGYTLFFYIAAANKVHPNYVSYLMNKRTLSVSAVNEILGPDTPFEGGMTAIEAANKVRERLICPADKDIKSSKSDPYYYVKVEREENPLFPVLPNGVPGIKKGLSMDEARRVIRNERTIEFAFEDQYFYDVLRWKEGKEHIATTIYGCDVVKSGDNFTYSRVVVEDRSNSFDENRMYLYPIPQDEVYILGVQQNPGW